MPVEIERKFLVANDTWRQFADAGVKIVQGYVVNTDHCSVRIRIGSTGKCTLTTKLPRSGMSRYEFEHDIEQSEAENLMELCGDAIVEKVRFKITHGGLVWEIDTFSGLNDGLTVAEIELEQEDQTFTRPSWLGEEVTGLEQYQNSRLASRPYSQWNDTIKAPAALAFSDMA
ncbi:MAG: CYTH domain-containing protein [Rhizobiales bacterium]|nr:CYTH domain-containing protein [Hyphomicrobiales bacterium]